MGGPEKKPEDKKTENPRAAGQAAPKEAAPYKAGKAAVADEVAQAAVAPEKPDEGKDTPVEDTEELSDNEWSRAYYEMLEHVKANPENAGAMTNFALALLKMAAKYGKYLDVMPGRFEERITESEEFKGKKLNAEQIKKIEAKADLVAKSEDEKKVADDLVKLAADEKARHRKLGKERASTKFAANVLFGMDDFDDSANLAASLIHTKKSTDNGDVALYAIAELKALKNKEIEPGTLIIFIPEMKSGEKVVAYATGNPDKKDEFVYYDIEEQDESKRMKRFQLNSPNCPVKAAVGLQTVLVPNHGNFKEAKEAAPAPEQTAEATQNPQQNPEDLLKKSFDIIEKQNKAVADKIRSGKDVAQVKVVAAENLKAAEQAKGKLKGKNDKISFDELERFNKIYEAAKKNDVDAKKLEIPKK